MKKNLKKFIILGSVVFYPFFAMTASALDFKGFIENIKDQLDIIPGFIIGLAILFFIYNVFQYIQAGDPKKTAEAGHMITYSIIFIFVMLSVWGLVGILVNTFFPGGSAPVTLPSIPS